MMMLDECGHAMRIEGGGGVGGPGYAGATTPRTPKHQDVKERQQLTFILAYEIAAPRLGKNRRKHDRSIGGKQ
jgi:hypothetical protein